MPAERGKGREKSARAEQAAAYCHHESWGRKRIRQRVYNPQAKQCVQARPVGSPVIVFTMKVPITLVPSHTCGKRSLVSIVRFIIFWQYRKQLQSWEVSKQRRRSPPRGEDSRHREGAHTGGLTKLGRDGCRSHQSQGDSFQLLSASLESRPRSLLSWFAFLQD